MSGDKRHITPEDLYGLELITDLRISPDGRSVVYALQRVDRETEKKHSNLWLVDTAGGAPRQFTYGDQVDGNPRWSPDGRSIAFLSNRQDEKQPQLYVIPLAGGEARPLTTLKGSFADFEWSPDGSKFVCMFRQKDPEQLEREEDEQKKKLGVVQRHITDLSYKLDGSGYNPKERWHLWIVDAAGGEATQLTDGDFHEQAPTWSPDGREILFISDRNPESLQGLISDDVELYVMPAGGGDMRKIPAHDGRKFIARFSPDGQQIAYLGHPERDGKWWQNVDLYVLPVEGGEPKNLTLSHNVDISSHTLGDFGSPPPLSIPTWAHDGRSIFVNYGRYGGDHIARVTLDGELHPIVSDGYVNANFSLDAAQNTLAFFHAEPYDPCQVCVHTLESGETRQLTHHNRELLDQIKFGALKESWIKGKDGHDIHGWILLPPDFDPEETYPSILEIHGGPQTQYGRTFMHEFHYLASLGYVVHYCNPRGGQGYGNAHAGAIYTQWGTVDYADLMAWTDYVASQPYVDPERMGVTGGSYGGYMTTLIIGRTNRFKAAAPQRLVSNLVSFHGSSDMNWGAKHLVGIELPPWEDLPAYWRVSPLSQIGHAQTPTLIIHSEADYRCDKEQAEQVFVALKLLGVDTELVLFPEEGHGLSRTGRTDRRIVRLEHIARWMHKYLIPEGEKALNFKSE